MVDRNARDRLAYLIRRYLNEELGTYAFDEELDQFFTSSDTTVRFVVDTLWCFYDDCVDHKVVLSKLQWDFIQRLLLVLDSNYVISITANRRWGFSQLCAGILLLCCVCLVHHSGFGYHLLVYFVPFGLGSIVLSWQGRTILEPNSTTAVLYPFSSLRELREVHVSTIFQKSMYPAHLGGRRIRSEASDKMMQICNYIAWSCLAPIPLFFQCFPGTELQMQVVPA